jgi:hypothetical protein
MNDIKYIATLKSKKRDVVYSESFNDTAELVFCIEEFVSNNSALYFLDIEAQVDNVTVKKFKDQLVEKLEFMTTVAELAVEKVVQDED